MRNGTRRERSPTRALASCRDHRRRSRRHLHRRAPARGRLPGLRDPGEGARASAAPGGTTAIPAPSATSSRTSTRSRSRPIPRGHGPTPASPRSAPTSRSASSASGSSRTSASAPRSHAARWDDDARVWHLTVGDGEVVEADVVVSALGMFGAPVAPEIPGLDRFTGTMFHSARWDDDHDLTGESVAVIGSAAERGAAHPRDRADRRRSSPCTSGRRTGSRRRRTRRSPTSSWPPSLPIPTPSPRSATTSSPPSIPTSPSTTPARRAMAEAAGLQNIVGGRGPRGAAQAHARHAVRVQATVGVERLLPDLQPAARRAGDRTDHRDHRRLGRHRRRPRADRSTPSSSPPGSRPRSSSARSTSSAAAACTSTTRGPTARRRTSASPPPASRTCSCCTGRTPTTARSST